MRKVELTRIGKKLISRNKLMNIIDQVLELRVRGIPQQEVAQRLNLDRSFISRLEKLGEVRKGNRVAVVGFPIKNKAEVADMLEKEGVDYCLLMTDRERWDFARSKNGLDFFNELMQIVARVRAHDIVVFIGSNYRIKLSEALLDKEVIGINIGESPIREDQYVDPEKLRRLISSLIEGKDNEDCRQQAEGGCS